MKLSTGAAGIKVDYASPAEPSETPWSACPSFPTVNRLSLLPRRRRDDRRQPRGETPRGLAKL